MSCHHEHDIHGITQQILNLDFLGGSFNIILAMLVYGVIGSFTHCAMMCGPIAAGQMSIRLMHLKSYELTNVNKLKCALSVNYYLGKACTYGFLAATTYLISSGLKDYLIFRYLALTLIIVAAFICLKIAIKAVLPNLVKFNVKDKSFKKIEVFLTKKIMKLRLSPFGINGFYMGLLLGFIPCGLVVAAIAIITAFSQNWILAFIAAFSFGIGTFPALFLVSIIGQNFIKKQRKHLNVFYSILMFINAVILFNYAYNLI